MSTSLDNMDKSNAGGVGAKKGFLYQDYIAALYVTKMLRDKQIVGVCCEVRDDIDILYQGVVEYLQIKTTDADKKWGAQELCQRSKKKDSRRYNDDSILQKSILCDNSKIFKGRFGIISSRDVDASLLYLKSPFDKRVGKEEKRAKLIGLLSNKIKKCKSPNQNDIEYWVDNCYWQCYQDIEYVKLLCLSNIRKACVDSGYMHDPNEGDTKILNGILVKVTELSAISKTQYLSKDKTYFRNDLIEWFNKEVISLIGPRKIYSRDANSLPGILEKLNDFKSDDSLNINGVGYYQSYDRKTYRFDFISNNMHSWLPELYLRPEEISNMLPTGIMSKANEINLQILSEKDGVKALIPKVLLHSVIRHYSRSQPIPAALYLEKNGDLIEFDNIHIVVKTHEADELWFGISCWDEGQGIIDSFIGKVLSFIDVTFDEHKKIILDIKSDDYLVKHDIDSLLNPIKSVSDSLKKLFFVFFIGYVSGEQTLNVQKNYEDRLKNEILLRFNNVVDVLDARKLELTDLNFIVYVYPIPCINSLVTSFSNKISGV